MGARAGVGAAPCPAPPAASPALAQIDSELRLRFIQDQLAPAAHRARVWTWAWGLGYGAATVGSLALVPLFDDPGQRVDQYFSASKSAVATVTTFVPPLSVMADQRTLAARAASASGTTEDADRCALLSDAEDRLARDAEQEARVGSWLWHAGGILFNLAAGLALGFGWDRWPSAVLQMASGIVIGEIQIYTQPVDAVEALRRYRAGDLSPATRAAGPAFSLAPYGGGLMITMAF